jgi:uncharacterized membrane protein
MLVAGLKRLALLVGLVLAVAVVVGVLGALLLHVPFRRSLSVTCYSLGAFFLVSGFFHGVRPAVRVEEDAGVMSMFGLLLTSAMFVGVALVLILIGGLVDPVHHLF